MIEDNGSKEPINSAFVKEFDKCPSCGCADRFFESLGKEMKEPGLVKPEMKFYYDMKSAPLANNEIMAKLPIGGEVPAFALATDICLNCGAIYAVRLEKAIAKKGLAPVQFQPNRAQRRAGLNGGSGFKLPPRTNNPQFS